MEGNSEVREERGEAGARNVRGRKQGRTYGGESAAQAMARDNDVLHRGALPLLLPQLRYRCLQVVPHVHQLHIKPCSPTPATLFTGGHN